MSLQGPTSVKLDSNVIIVVINRGIWLTTGPLVVALHTILIKNARYVVEECDAAEVSYEMQGYMKPYYNYNYELAYILILYKML